MVVEVTTLGVNVSWIFIAEHSEVETAGVVETREREGESKTAGPGPGSTSGEQELEQQHGQVDWEQPGVIRPEA